MPTPSIVIVNVQISLSNKVVVPLTLGKHPSLTYLYTLSTISNVDSY